MNRDCLLIRNSQDFLTLTKTQKEARNGGKGGEGGGGDVGEHEGKKLLSKERKLEMGWEWGVVDFGLQAMASDQIERK